MPDDAKTEIEIAIDTTYNGRGVEEARKDVAELGGSPTASAAAGDNSGADGARSRLLREQMHLEGMAYRELQAEILRLVDARSAAIKAGRTEDYTRLTRELQMARTAFTQLNQTRTIDSMATMQQAQAGLAFSGGLRSLAQGVTEGTTSIGSMTSQVMALGMALKAGLGPIGWMMAAVEALQAAWDAYNGSQAKQREAMQRNIAIDQAAFERAVSEIQRMGNISRSRALEGVQRQIDEATRAARIAAEAEEAIRRRAADAAAAEAETRRQVARTTYEQERLRLETLESAGKLSRAEAETRRRAAEDAMQAELTAIDRTAAARAKADAQAAADRADKLAKAEHGAIEEAYAPYADLLKIKLPTRDEWEELQLKLRHTEAGAEEKRLQRDWISKINAAKDAMAALGISVEGGIPECLAMVGKLREGREAATRQAEDARRSAAASADGVQAAEDNARLAEQRADASRLETEAARELADARDAEARRSSEWAEVSRRSLDEQEAWLRRQATQVKAGSTAAQQLAAKLRAVSAACVAEEMDGLAAATRTSRTYAVEVSEGQARILLRDARLLHEREAQLRTLAATPDMDAATLKRINAALRDTQREIAGVEQAMRRNAAESRAWLKTLKPPHLEASKRGLQGNLNRLSRAYAATAKRAEKAAVKGDEKALNRYKASLQSMARSMDRYAKGTSAGSKLWKQTEDALTGVSKESRATGKNAKAAAKSGRDRARAEAKAAKEAQKQANDLKRGGKQGRQLAATTSGTRAIQDAMREQNARLADLDAELSSLAASSRDTAATAASAAAACASAVAALRKETSSLRAAIDRLRRK